MQRDMYPATQEESASASNIVKYTVADILSSMANGGEAVSSPFSDANFLSGVLTGSTPTLTPTTIASIEQTFIELQSVSTAGGASADPTHQAGFVPPVVHPHSAGNMIIKSEYDYYTTDDSKSSEADWMPVAKRSRPDDADSVLSYGQPGGSPSTSGTPQRKTPGRKAKNDVLPPVEDAKRRVRRERNKLAAAKCRQRRVDHTNELLGETEDLEEVRAKLEGEIQQLQQQKEQLQFLLDAHKPMCNVPKLIVKPDPEPTTSSTGVPLSIKSENAAVTLSTQLTRPTSLPLTVQNMSATTPSGSGLNSTPSNVYGQLGLDNLMEGHSGLTPITGAPTHITGAPGCAREAKRHSSDSSPSDNGLASPTQLLAL